MRSFQAVYDRAVSSLRCVSLLVVGVAVALGVLASAADAQGPSLASPIAETPIAPSLAEPLPRRPASATGLGYSLTPSSTEPYATCPAPEKGKEECLSVVVAGPAAIASAKSKYLSGTSPTPSVLPSLQGEGEGGGFSPKDLRSAYKLPTEGGSGQTVAIVDAFDDPNAEADLAEYRERYKLRSCTKEHECFKKVNQEGKEENYPASSESWSLEISLDLDMVSAACPECKILLVEANNNTTNSEKIYNLYLAEEEAAAKGATEISNSWGGEERAGETEDDKYFEHPDIPITVASGDYGYYVEYPAASPDVIAVGGTALEKSSDTRGWSEEVWPDTGSGCSEYETKKPAWQTEEGCSHRMDNDVSAVASLRTPVSVYDSFGEKCTPKQAERYECWRLVGGTSVAAPILAGVEALSSTAFRDEGPEAFYTHQSSLFDVAWGNNGSCAPPADHEYYCVGLPAYDGPTGNGTPDVDGIAGPTVTTATVTGMTEHGASLRGSVNPGGPETHYHFEYGTSTAYGKTVPATEASAGSGTSDQVVTQGITGLSTGTTYHYRLVATNKNGTVDGEDRTFVASTRWAVQSTPNPTGGERGSPLQAVSCSSASACTAVGYYIPSGGGNALLAERWNGTEWTMQTIASPEREEMLDGVSCPSASVCVAVGKEGDVPLAERWNGSEWSAQTIPAPSGAERDELKSVSCSATTSCTAVGTYFAAGAKAYVTFAEHWNGTEWSVQTTPDPVEAAASILEGVSCSSSTACTAVGYYYLSSGGKYMPVAERWNGTEWKIQSTPTGATILRGVSCKSSTACTAVGEDIGELETTAVAERWNGTEWSIQTTPEPPGVERSLTRVSCSSTSTCTAVGWAQEDHHESQVPFSENWNGTEWTIEPVTIRFELTLNGVSCSSSIVCMAVGKYNGTTVSQTLAERRIAAKPFAETKAATAVKIAKATLNAEIDAEEEEGEYYFEYGPTTSYGMKTNEVGAGMKGVEVSKTIAGLLPDSQYHFRVVVRNESGTAYGADQTLTTQPAVAPSASTLAASGVGGTRAVLNSDVDPNEQETTYHFEYGKTTSYGTSVPVPSANAGSGESSLEEHKTITGLEPNTTYHYRVVATNTAGSTDGTDKTFTTLAAPAWQLAGSPNPSGAKQARLEGTSCTSVSACTAVGYYESKSGVRLALAQAYNGEEWTEQTTLKPSGAKESELIAVSCSSSSACTAVGSYLNSSGVAVPLAERWNGEAWSVQEPPAPSGAKESGLFGVSCASSSACTAVGAYTNSAGAYTTLAESWNGTSWSVKETPNPSGAKQDQLVGVSCTASNACTAVGEYENSAGTAWLAQAERWNGEAWSLQEPANPTGAYNTWPYGVSCMSSSACTLVGYYDSHTEGDLTLAESWNGKTWSLQSTPNPNGSGLSKLVGVACASSTACTAVGYYWKGEPVEELTLAEHWNGTEWSVQSTPNPSGAPYSILAGVSCNSSTTCVGVGHYVKSKSEEDEVTLAEIYG
jgi:hypothetical protein